MTDTKKTHRYYTTQRPASPGAVPKDGLVETVWFQFKTHVVEIDKMAWGYVEYDRELSDKEVEDYELTPDTPVYYFGYAKYEDGSVMCHAAGFGCQIDDSESRIRESYKGRVRFKRNKVTREQFEKYTR